MKPVKNVVFVDFRKGRGAALRGPGSGSRLAVLIFAAFLGAELLCSAVLFPSVIASAFFGPTAIALAVAVALGSRRALDSYSTARARGKVRGRSRAPESGDGHTGRTLH
ncbi:MAG: hypothetical protein HY900_04595 [Deltaproteobacteria bacterium]|nr:hypothetical protein [Deltaproteobacteria bacterium]